MLNAHFKSLDTSNCYMASDFNHSLISSSCGSICSEVFISAIASSNDF